MSSPRRRSRPVPRKARPRPTTETGANAYESADERAESTSPEPAAPAAPVAALRGPTRSQNRAAKRATGVRAKKVRSGGVSGRRSRGYSPVVIGLAGAAVLGVAVLLAIGGFGGPSASGSPGASQAAFATPHTNPYGDGTCPSAQPAPLPAGQNRTVTITTSLGDIVIKVDGALSPIAAGNFVALVACHYYDNVAFHRTAALSDGTPFVIQGGDPDGTGSGPGPGYSIQDETVTTKYHRGTVAMARTSQPNSQGSQFFIVLDDKAEPPLSSANTYAIFGEVTAGMDVADAIFGASAGEEIPATPIRMLSVTLSGGPVPSFAPSSAPTAAPTAAPSAATSPAATSAAPVASP